MTATRDGMSEPSAPSVSVCMATYNGQRWLPEQLSSILTELDVDDEVVIVDDASTDDTVQVATSFDDPRVRVVRQATNRGYVRTFEHALTLARRDIVFLSDQDDVWVPGRRDALIAALEGAEVAAGELLLHPDGRPLPHPITRRPWRLGAPGRGHRLARQLRIWMGTAPYFGCAMAVRRPYLDVALPFPAFLTESHDLWLATLSNAGGVLSHATTPTVLRRLHESNTSPSRPRGPVAVLAARIMLARCSREAVVRSRRVRAAARS